MRTVNIIFHYCR